MKNSNVTGLKNQIEKGYNEDLYCSMDRMDNQKNKQKIIDEQNKLILFYISCLQERDQKIKEAQKKNSYMNRAIIKLVQESKKAQDEIKGQEGIIYSQELQLAYQNQIMQKMKSNTKRAHLASKEDSRFTQAVIEERQQDKNYKCCTPKCIIF